MRNRIIGIAVTLAIAASPAVLAVTAARASAPGKVFVCKYVGQPGVDETLQTGQNPIEVSVNSIQEYQDNDHSGSVTPGDEFSDAQGRSVVVATESCGSETPTETPSPTVSPTPSETPSESPSPSPSETVSPTPSPTQPPAGDPGPSCSPQVRFGDWYGDPRVDITLVGPGRFVVKGGLYRTTGKRVVRATLGCGQTLDVTGYKVHGGKTLRVYLNGALYASRRAPILNG